MYVIDPIGKRSPTGSTTALWHALLYFPPWHGPTRRRCCRTGTAISTTSNRHAGIRGGARVRLRPIHARRLGAAISAGAFPWHFRAGYERLEIALLPDPTTPRRATAFSKWAPISPNRRVAPFSLNFDIIAHEAGHLIIYSEIGVPADDAIEGEYYGFHESAADLVALLARRSSTRWSIAAREDARQSLRLQSAQSLRRGVRHKQIRMASNDRSCRRSRTAGPRSTICRCR